jgi:hypothetical protein
MNGIFWGFVALLAGVWVVMVVRSRRRGGRDRTAMGASGNMDPDPTWLAQLDDGRPPADTHHGNAPPHHVTHDGGAHSHSSPDHATAGASHDSGHHSSFDGGHHGGFDGGHHGGFDGGSSGGFDGGHHGGGFDGGFGGHH